MLGLPPAILILLRAPYPRPHIPLARDRAISFVRACEQARALPNKIAPLLSQRGLVDRTGFEPVTPSMSRKYSNQLS